MGQNPGVQAAPPDSPPSDRPATEPLRPRSGRPTSTAFVALGCAIVLGFGAFALAQSERPVAAATQSDQWISNCTTPGVVAFTGSASAALAWMDEPPQAGQCWTILYSNPNGSSPPATTTTTTTTTLPKATTTTLPKICIHRAYDHRRLCHLPPLR
jgi:hypothetical protein